MKPLCIYHGNCDDGFGAAWAVWKKLGADVEFYPGVSQKEPPPHAGRDVLFVDFSYKRPVLDAMSQQARSILILDHHKTAAEDLAGLPPPLDGPYDPERMVSWARDCNAPAAFHALFDMQRSGAGIAWDYFHPEKSRPKFINYLEDRDLWRKALPGGDEFTIALRSYPQELDLWDKLADDVDGLIRQGGTIQRYYRLRVEELKRSAYGARLGNDRCLISNAPYFAASEVAGELAEKSDTDFGACYFEAEQGRFQYSLRSRGDFDVSAVARRYGGGGHKNAAGFTSDGHAHIAL